MVCRDENVISIRDRVRFAAFIGQMNARFCKEEQLTCFEVLKKLIPVIDNQDIEEGLYQKDGGLVGVIHDSQNVMSVLQILGMAMLPFCRLKHTCSFICKNYRKCNDEIQLILVAFCESFLKEYGVDKRNKVCAEF